MQEETSKFSIINTLLHKNNNKETQYNIILSIFLEIGYENKISKRNLEKQYALSYSLKDINLIELLHTKLSNLSSNEEIKKCFIENVNLLPGDLQRNIRSFYDMYKKYGLKKEGTGQNIKYYWQYITDEEYNKLLGIKLIHRNIFRTDNDRKKFIDEKDRKCEICGSKERLAIDHWRAFSVYKIDSENIAVLLCEKCNNIHHNYDASKIIKHNKDNIKYIKKWIIIEKRIRELGYMPNKEDIELQNNIIDEVNIYLITNGISSFTELMDMKII